MTTTLACIKNRIEYLMLLVIGIFMFSVLWRDAHSPWAFAAKAGSVSDNYFIALNAKNISEGKGWGLYDGYKFVPFERKISTGPVVFLPVVLAKQWVSDPDDARYLGVILLNVFLSVILLVRLRRFFDAPVYRMLWLLVPFVFLAYMREQWYLVLGETAASLLLLISATYAAEKIADYKTLLLSGFFASLAMFSKLLALLSVPWIVMVLVATLMSQAGARRGLRIFLPWLGGFCVVPGLIAIWHFIGFDGDLGRIFEYVQDWYARSLAVVWTGSMEGSFCPNSLCFSVNFRTASGSWPNSYGALLQSLTLLVPLVGLFLLFKKNKKQTDILLIIFSGICVAQFLFYYFNGTHKQSRYYFIGGCVALFALAIMLVACLNRLSSARLRLGAFITVLILAIGLSLPLYREKNVDPYHRDIIQVATYLNNNRSISEFLWWNFGPMTVFPFSSYYLHETRWWSIYGFVEDKFTRNTEKLQADADFYWKGRHNYYFLLEKWQDAPLSTDVCLIEHFRNDHFRILECSPDELEVIFTRLSEGKMRFPKGVPGPQ